MLYENVDANPKKKKKRNARLECFTSWVLEDDENNVNIVLSVYMYFCIWYALYHNSLISYEMHAFLRQTFFPSIHRHYALVLKCILTNTFLNGSHLVKRSSSSSWTQSKCSLNMAHYIVTDTLYMASFARVLLYRCSRSRKRKSNRKILKTWISSEFWWLSLKMWKRTASCKKSANCE